MKKSLVIKIVEISVVALALLVLAFSILTLAGADNEEFTPFNRAYCTINDDHCQEYGVVNGDMVIVKEIENLRELTIGDVVVFEIESRDTLKMGKIVDINVDRGVFFTITNSRYHVEADDIVGVYVFDDETIGKVWKGYGDFVEFVRSAWGYVIFILIPGLLLVSVLAVEIVKILQLRKRANNSNIEK